MWSVLLLIGLTKAVSYVAGIASTVDEKSGESPPFYRFSPRSSRLFPLLLFRSFCLSFPLPVSLR